MLLVVVFSTRSLLGISRWKKHKKKGNVSLLEQPGSIFSPHRADFILFFCKRNLIEVAASWIYLVDFYLPVTLNKIRCYKTSGFGHGSKGAPAFLRALH